MEVKKVEKQRNYSLDLLRVIAILMIIVFHICYKALIFNNLSEFNKLICCLLPTFWRDWCQSFYAHYRLLFI